MKKAGLFKINYWYYAYKIASQFLLVGLAAWCASSPTYAGFFSGAVCLCARVRLCLGGWVGG